MEIVTPWSTVGFLTYARTYSRDKEDGTKESFYDTIERVINACDVQLNCGFSDEETNRLREYMLKLKGTVAGRFLWQLGTETVNRLGLASLQNCAFVTVDNPEAFTWTFDMLMLGSGVGYNIQSEHVNKLPPVREDFEGLTRQDDASADFIVPDTREGWVRLLHRCLASGLGSGSGEGECIRTYSTHCIRSKGSPIKGFGGIASGPEDLVRGIEQISSILKRRRGKQLRPIDCLDIMNIIGSIVVAGNVRRSAQIAIGDYDDLDFIRAKNWSTGKIPSWRAMSNNSVVCDDISKLPAEFWDGYRGNGEPYGLINLALARSCGRVGDTRYPDPRVAGFNPCAEQSLEDGETCCLAEVYLPNVGSFGEFIDLLGLLYRINKHSLALPCHQRKTEEVVHQNMRMGIGITGVLQSSDEQLGWLEDAYEYLRALDREYSAEKGWPTSIKLTTIKPSGTLSLLPGVTPGIHPGYAQYMIRRIRVAAGSPLIDVCRSHGYHVEPAIGLDGEVDHSTEVIEFPFSYPEGAVLEKDLTAIDQLCYIRRMQREWSDNSVSCTVYYKLEELEEIIEFLKENYNENFKTVSFLLHSGHGFKQAPFEEITKERYEEMVANTRVITSLDTFEVNFDSDDECASGMCPIR